MFQRTPKPNKSSNSSQQKSKKSSSYRFSRKPPFFKKGSKTKSSQAEDEGITQQVPPQSSNTGNLQVPQAESSNTGNLQVPQAESSNTGNLQQAESSNTGNLQVPQAESSNTGNLQQVESSNIEDPQELKSGFDLDSDDEIEDEIESSNKEDTQKLKSGFDLDSDDEIEDEIENETESQDNTPKYTEVFMRYAKKAAAGEGLFTKGLTDCSAVAVLSNFDPKSQIYEDMAMFHIAGSDVDSVVNDKNAMPLLQNIAKGEYIVVIVFGKDSSSETAKGMLTGQSAIKNLLAGAKTKVFRTGMGVKIDRSGNVVEM